MRRVLKHVWVKKSHWLEPVYMSTKFTCRCEWTSASTDVAPVICAFPLPNTLNNYMRWPVLFLLIYNKKLSSERLNTLLKSTQLIRGITVLLHSPCPNHYGTSPLRLTELYCNQRRPHMEKHCVLIRMHDTKKGQ